MINFQKSSFSPDLLRLIQVLNYELKENICNGIVDELLSQKWQNTNDLEVLSYLQSHGYKISSSDLLNFYSLWKAEYNKIYSYTKEELSIIEKLDIQLASNNTQAITNNFLDNLIYYLKIIKNTLDNSDNSDEYSMLVR